MSFFLKLKKKKVACHQTLLVYLPSLCAVLLPLFSNCFIKKKIKENISGKQIVVLLCRPGMTQREAGCAQVSPLGPLTRVTVCALC